jgi:hypothetical protein
MLMNNYLTASADDPIVKLIDFGMSTRVDWDFTNSCTHFDIIAAMLIFDVCMTNLTLSFRK